MELKTKSRIRILCFWLLMLSVPIVLRADTCFRSAENDTARSNTMFVGKLIDISYGKFWSHGVNLGAVYTFDVSESFAGLSESDKYVSIIGSGCCHPIFSVDSTYLIFAHADECSMIFVDRCSNSALLSASRHRYELLGQPIKHNHSNLNEYSIIKADAFRLDSLKQRKAYLENEVTVLSSKSTKRGYVIVGLGVLTVLLSAALLSKNKRVR